MALLGIPEGIVLIILYLTFTARFAIKAFATEPWMYYLGKNIKEQ